MDVINVGGDTCLCEVRYGKELIESVSSELLNLSGKMWSCCVLLFSTGGVERSVEGNASPISAEDLG